MNLKKQQQIESKYSKLELDLYHKFSIVYLGKTDIALKAW